MKGNESQSIMNEETLMLENFIDLNLNIESTALQATENKMNGYFNRAKLISKIDILLAWKRSFVAINEAICQFFTGKLLVLTIAS